jgi:inhibitor of KinA sporulation pathway (predicted exonuclease)
MAIFAQHLSVTLRTSAAFHVHTIWQCAVDEATILSCLCKAAFHVHSIWQCAVDEATILSCLCKAAFHVHSIWQCALDEATIFSCLCKAAFHVHSIWQCAVDEATILSYLCKDRNIMQPLFTARPISMPMYRTLKNFLCTCCRIVYFSSAVPFLHKRYASFVRIRFLKYRSLGPNI